MLSEYRSAGVRARLLLHACNCFIESKGFGVGLGNTSQLAVQRQIAEINGEGRYLESIHCFIVRLLADYGIFAGIPISVIALLMLRSVWQAMAAGRKKEDRELIGRALFLLVAILLFPIVSTSSSDAQDSIPMWIFLASVIWESDSLALLAKRGTESNA